MQNEMIYPAYAPTEESDSAFLTNGFDPVSPLETIGGTHVAILTTNGPGNACIIGICLSRNDLLGLRHNAALETPGKLHRWNVKGKSYDMMGHTPRSMDLRQNVLRNFNWLMPFKTRGGHGVRVISSNRLGEQTHVALVRERDRERIMLYYDNGKVSHDGSDSQFDLINT